MGITRAALMMTSAAAHHAIDTKLGKGFGELALGLLSAKPNAAALQPAAEKCTVSIGKQDSTFARKDWQTFLASGKCLTLEQYQARIGTAAAAARKELPDAGKPDADRARFMLLLNRNKKT
jgi:hypothetical protein